MRRYKKKGKRYIRTEYEEYEIAYEAAQRKLKRRGYDMYEEKYSSFELKLMLNAAKNDNPKATKSQLINHLISRQKGELSHKEALGYAKLSGNKYSDIRYGKIIDREDLRYLASKKYWEYKNERINAGYGIDAGLWAAHQVSQNIFGSP